MVSKPRSDSRLAELMFQPSVFSVLRLLRSLFELRPDALSKTNGGGGQAIHAKTLLLGSRLEDVPCSSRRFLPRASEYKYRGQSGRGP